MANNPMQQFSVHKIGPEIKIGVIDLSFTNASLFMVISASIILIFFTFQFLDNSKFLTGDENNNVKQLSKENATIRFANELSVISIRQSKKSQLFKQT